MSFSLAADQIAEIDGLAELDCLAALVDGTIHVSKISGSGGLTDEIIRETPIPNPIH